MAVDYFILKFIFNNNSKFIIWCQNDNDKDSIVLNKGKISVFDTIESVFKYTAKEINLENICEWEYDVAELEKFLVSHSKNIDCRLILNFWNIFNDIAYTLGIKIPNERTRKADRIYNKLFFGNNLPSITPENECYTPIFTRKERNFIRWIMNYGLELLYKNIEGEQNEYRNL